MFKRTVLTAQPRGAVSAARTSLAYALDSWVLPYASRYTVNGTLTAQGNAAGYGLSSADSSVNYASTVPTCANAGGDFTFLWNGTINGATQNPGLGYFTDVQGYLWYSSNFAGFSNQLIFGLEVSGSFHDLLTPAYTYTSGKPLTIVAAYGANTAAYLAVDGVLLGTSAAPGVARTTTTGASYLAGSAGGSSIGGAQTTNLGAVWNRGLTQQEALSLSRNPWQIFAPPPRRLWVVGASTGLSGTATLTFGQTGVLAGAGALAATAALTIGQTGALKGSGALVGTSALTFNQTGAVTGAGVLTGTSALTFAQSGLMTAAGVLAGSSALVFGQTGTVGSPGVLAGSSALAFGQTGTLTAKGILAGASALTFAQTAALAASGALAGTSALVFGASATADIPAGALQGTASLSFGASGTLTGFGALIGACQIVIDCSGTLTQPDSGRAGPVDSQRSAEGYYRRKKKLRKLGVPAEPVFISPASLERAPAQAVIDRVPDFTGLAQTLGETPAALSARIDREIEFLMREAQERDDEEALVLILTALD